MQAFEAGLLWGGTVTYPKTVGAQQIEAYHAWTDNVNNYPDGSSIVFWSYQPAMEEIVILAAYEDVAGNEAPAGFDKFMAVPGPLASTMRMASHKELTDELEQPAGYRWVSPFLSVLPKVLQQCTDDCTATSGSL
jgi:hypothetical protein